MKDELTKNTQLRNNEYFRKQEEFDYLYTLGKKGHKFTNLIGRIICQDNLRLAYRNIKGNKGKNSKGVSGKTLKWISKMKLVVYLKLIKRNILNYTPGKIRRVGIPKSNGKIRYLGIKEPVDRITEQAIFQILDPIVTAKFHNNSNGFIKGRNCKRAISQMTNYIIKDKLYFVVDIDIKGFFDNVDHGKLLKQLWALGIRDKNLLSIISKMLKAEVLGVGIPDKGTPQGGILSPLLANVYLNELDWWLDSKKNKGIRFVRYADDFKILCPTYSIARDMLEKTTIWLQTRLKLQVSEEKTKIVNLKRNYSEFLGIKIKVKKHKNKYKIVSHVKENAQEEIKEKVKKQIKVIKKEKSKSKKIIEAIDLFNAMVSGIHNYYEIATEINYDLSKIDWIIRRYIFVNFKDVLTFSNEFPSEYITKRYCANGKVLPCIRGKPMIPIGNITHNFKMYRSSKINYYEETSRKNFHKSLQIDNEFIIDKLLLHPYMDESVEFNDNIIPVFCGQLGKYKITNELILDYKNIEVIKINQNVSDHYNNMIIVNKQVAKLLKIKGDDIIENMMLKKGVKSEQLRKINEIRKENNLSLI